jgi:DNA-binding NarL/FixJ family response regulator
LKVVVIDDEKAMHLIMKRLLTKYNGVEIVGMFQETATAFSFLQVHKVDLAFIDINMVWESGLDFAKRLRESGWTGKLVFITSYKEYALKAFEVYAFDYIVKPISENRLRTTIQRAISEGKEDIKPHSTSLPVLIEPLTKREIDVIKLMGYGYPNKQIAQDLGLTEGTVKHHIFNIYSKLQVKNRVKAIIIANEIGLI